MNIDFYDIALLQGLGAAEDEKSWTWQNAYSLMIYLNHLLAPFSERTPAGLPYSRLKKLFKGGLIDHRQGEAPRERHLYRMISNGQSAYLSSIRESIRNAAQKRAYELDRLIALLLKTDNKTLILEHALDIELILIRNDNNREVKSRGFGADSDNLEALNYYYKHRDQMLKSWLMDIKRIYIDDK